MSTGYRKLEISEDNVIYCGVRKCDDPVHGHINWPLNVVTFFTLKFTKAFVNPDLQELYNVEIFERPQFRSCTFYLAIF